MDPLRHPRRTGLLVLAAVVVIAVLVFALAVQLAMLAVGLVVALVVVVAIVAGWSALMDRLGWHLPPPGRDDERARRFRRARRRGRSL